MKRSTLRFLWIVQGPGVGGVGVAAALLGFASYMAASNPSGFDQAVAIALFLQMFSASSGYRDRLRRGHLDPVLAGHTNRWRVAAAHWLASTGLGLAVWVLLGLIAVAADLGHWPTPFTAPGVIVLLYVSTVVWASTLALPQYSGAVLWLVVLFGLAATQHLQALRVAFNPGVASIADALQSVGSSMVFPILLLIAPSTVSAVVLAGVFASTLLIWCVGAAMIRRFDGCLSST